MNCFGCTSGAIIIKGLRFILVVLLTGKDRCDRPYRRVKDIPNQRDSHESGHPLGRSHALILLPGVARIGMTGASSSSCQHGGILFHGQ
jgi:hypothetical protein